MIALNRRSFPGSTPLTVEGLAPLRAPKVGHEEFTTFIRERAFELISFVYQITLEIGLPTKIDGGGSVSLLGWSLGSTYLLSVVEYLDNVDRLEDWYQKVKDSISTFIIFGTY